jgi:hypothetical protein
VNQKFGNLSKKVCKCDELALENLNSSSFLSLRQNLDKNQNLDKKNQFLPYSNNLADFNNVYKEFLPRKSSQRIPRKKILTKNFSKKFLKKDPPK